MQLKLKRSQRDGGIISKTAIFCLDARVEFTRAEQQNITRYKLAGQVIYNSEASKKHLDRADQQQDGSLKGSLKSLASVALAAMKLNISIASLERGQHIECKSLDELLGAEDAIMTACQNLKGYLAAAATFDGREVLVDFADEEPRVVAHATTPDLKLIAPPREIADGTDPHAQFDTPAGGSEPQDAEWREERQFDGQASWDFIVAFCRDPANRPKLIGASIALLLLLMLFNCRG